VDGINVQINATAEMPESAVVLITKQNNDSTTAASNTNDVLMLLDVENKFIYIGDSTLFWYDAYLTGHRGTFLNNVMYYVANAAKYGSHFTDLLLEGDGGGINPRDLGDGRVAQPAPWDEAYWGRNVMTEITK
jgi:hypothetical protein